MRFADTNVLLYAVSTDPVEGDKARRARDLLHDGHDLCLSVQVLGEFYVQATRPGRPGRMTHDQARRLVESFTRFRVEPLTLGVVRSALDARARWGLSYWDALVVETARATSCTEVLTEDLQHGQDLDGVRITNPFA